MTREEAIKAYMKQFGGFPFMLTRGMPEETLVKLVEEALRTGETIAISVDPDQDY